MKRLIFILIIPVLFSEYTQAQKQGKDTTKMFPIKKIEQKDSLSHVFLNKEPIKFNVMDTTSCKFNDLSHLNTKNMNLNTSYYFASRLNQNKTHGELKQTDNIVSVNFNYIPESQSGFRIVFRFTDYTKDSRRTPFLAPVFSPFADQLFDHPKGLNEKWWGSTYKTVRHTEGYYDTHHDSSSLVHSAKKYRK